MSVSISCSLYSRILSASNKWMNNCICFYIWFPNPLQTIPFHLLQALIIFQSMTFVFFFIFSHCFYLIVCGNREEFEPSLATLHIFLITYFSVLSSSIRSSAAHWTQNMVIYLLCLCLYRTPFSTRFPLIYI
jgi:hypothetical protein